MLITVPIAVIKYDGDKMVDEKIFYIIPREDLCEIVLKSNLSEMDLFADINFILSSKNYYKTISVSQLFAIKLNEDNYKFEIQLNVDKSEMNPILSFIKGMNYKQIQ